MELKEIQHFLNNHTGVQYFDKDLELFKQKFPHSKLIPELDNAQKYNKAQLDERMCYELLSEGGQCIDCLWEYRGYMRDSEGFIVPFQEEDKFENDLLAIDLDGDLKYNDLKALVFGLQLVTANNKEKTYREALRVKKEELIEARKPLPGGEGANESNDAANEGKDGEDTSDAENAGIEGKDADGLEADTVIVDEAKTLDTTNTEESKESNEAISEKKSEDPESSTQE